MRSPLGQATDLMARQGLRRLQADTVLYHATRPASKICATSPVAMRALTVTGLRSRGARSGRSHRIPKQSICRVLHDAGRHRAELLFDARRTLRLRRLVERQKLR